jgi:hypothetical protein
VFVLLKERRRELERLVALLVLVEARVIEVVLMPGVLELLLVLVLETRPIFIVVLSILLLEGPNVLLLLSFPMSGHDVDTSGSAVEEEVVLKYVAGVGLGKKIRSGMRVMINLKSSGRAEQKRRINVLE